MERKRDEAVRDGEIVLIIIVNEWQREQDREGEKCLAVALSCKKMK